MTEVIVQGDENPADAEARRAAWAARVPVGAPLDGEDVWAALEAKGVVNEGDRPWPKPPRRT